MKVLLTEEQWVTLNVENEREFVTAAFYLGLGVIYIQNRARYSVHEDERHEVVKTAISLGMTDEDIVIRR